MITYMLINLLLYWKIRKNKTKMGFKRENVHDVSFSEEVGLKIEDISYLVCNLYLQIRV